MKRDFKDFAGETFDLIVVGGGIIGAGIARDAAIRSLKTLLLEKENTRLKKLVANLHIAGDKKNRTGHYTLLAL